MQNLLLCFWPFFLFNNGLHERAYLPGCEIELSALTKDPCPGSDDGRIELEIAGGQPPYYLNWTDPSLSGMLLEELGPGIYGVTVTDQKGCSANLTVFLFPVSPPQYQLILEPGLCFGVADGTVRFESEDPLEYRINNSAFDTATVFTGLLPGVYSFSIRDTFDCTYEVSAHLPTPAPLTLELPETLHLFLGDTGMILPTGDLERFVSYSWEPDLWLSCSDCPTPLTFAEEELTYRLTATDERDCTREAEVRVVVDAGPRLYLPNAFTPDGDGYNDHFRPYVGDEQTEILFFYVFHRWGGRVFSVLNTPAASFPGWDGTLDGNPLEPGVFVYYLKVRFPDGKFEVFTGDVLLL